MKALALGGWLVLSGTIAALAADAPSPGPIVLNDDGAWSWFEDERAIVARGWLVVGSVAQGAREPSRRGDIDVVALHLKSGRITRLPLHKNLEADDHDSPAFLELPDGRLLAMYSKHGPENRVYSRTTRRPGGAIDWTPEQVVVPSPRSRITYSNLHFLRREGTDGRLYDFFRGLDDSFKPSWMVSDDLGATWRTGGLLVDVPGPKRHRPYVKYASDGRDTVHFLFTEGHPRDVDNSIYHAQIRRGMLCASDGSPIRPLADGPVLPEEATRVFAGDADNVGWIHDVALDRGGRVRAVYSVQKDSAGQPAGSGGSDLRYRWARWDGDRWTEGEIAYAGSRLYAGEDDYAGGICLHPDEPGTVFISTNVDPVTGAALPGGHHEIFRGRTKDDGGSWAWEALTPGATEDNLRPVVPHWRRGRTALVWLRGTYRKYTDYRLSVVCRLERR